jgi:hypothetical protein
MKTFCIVMLAMWTVQLYTHGIKAGLLDRFSAWGWTREASDNWLSALDLTVYGAALVGALVHP